MTTHQGGLHEISVSIDRRSGAVLAGLAQAEPLDLSALTGEMLSPEAYAALVSAATAANPPNDGETLTIGFANLSRDIPFTQLVEKSILENAERAGIEVVVADNQLDGPTALSVAQGFAQRNVDAVIEFQLDVNFGKAIMEVLTAAGAPVVAIDIPMPGAQFFGVNNRSPASSGAAIWGRPPSRISAKSVRATRPTSSSVSWRSRARCWACALTGSVRALPQRSVCHQIG